MNMTWYIYRWFDILEIIPKSNEACMCNYSAKVLSLVSGTLSKHHAFPWEIGIFPLCFCFLDKNPQLFHLFLLL